jgi:hypothetical protein
VNACTNYGAEDGEVGRREEDGLEEAPVIARRPAVEAVAVLFNVHGAETWTRGRKSSR